MEDDEAVRKLVEQIFIKKCPTTSEIIPSDSSLPDSLQSKEFWWKMRYVLFMRLFSIEHRWASKLDSDKQEMLHYHHSYLSFVMRACLSEHACNQNIFDSFINVCCLVEYCNSATLQTAGVNFCYLNSDIFMEFYHNVLKKTFRDRGGIQGLVEYIRHHEYLEWKWNRIDLVSPDGISSPVNFETANKVHNEMIGGAKFQQIFQHSETLLMREASTLAVEFLLNTSFELPALPSQEELIKKLVVSRKNKIAEESKDMLRFKIASELESIEEIRKGCSHSNSDSVTKNVAETIEDFARYKNIIQAVISHNRSRTSVLVDSNDSIQMKANRILEHLKDRIKRLIEVLDEYDKE